MNGEEILTDRRHVRFLLFLGEADRPMKESEFLALTSNYYTARAELGVLVAEGLVECVETDRSTARWYALTYRGRSIVPVLKVAIERMDTILGRAVSDAGGEVL